MSTKTNQQFTRGDYSREEFQVVKDRIANTVPRRFIDDINKRAENRINGKNGMGPCCEECNMKPAGLKTVSKRGDWGQLEFYQCLRCGHEFQGLRRYMYQKEEQDSHE